MGRKSQRICEIVGSLRAHFFNVYQVFAHLSGVYGSRECYHFFLEKQFICRLLPICRFYPLAVAGSSLSPKLGYGFFHSSSRYMPNVKYLVLMESILVLKMSGKFGNLLNKPGKRDMWNRVSSLITPKKLDSVNLIARFIFCSFASPMSPRIVGRILF